MLNFVLLLWGRVVKGGRGWGGWRRHVLAEGVTGLDHAIFNEVK